jgi:hypothetical protein
MKTKNFIEGINILSKYYTDIEGWHLNCEHDQFYCNTTDTELTKEDVEKMRELGWFQPDEEDTSGYNIEDGWSAFL